MSRQIPPALTLLLMAELKTTRNDGDVDAYLQSIDKDIRRRDGFDMRDLMTEVSGYQPEMWGTSIVGYGTYRYLSRAGGAGHEWFRIGFSARKQALTLYLMDGFEEYQDPLTKLGKHTTGKACLYVKNLEDVDRDVLTELLKRSLGNLEERNQS